MTQTLLTFDDNRLLGALFGGQNSHLHIIEDALGVQISTRGNEVMIKGGSRAKTDEAAQVLEALWARLQQGQDIDKNTVESALRFLESHHNGNTDEENGLGDFSEGAVQIKTRKKSIRPRSPVQTDYIQSMQENQLTFALGPAGTGKTYLAVAQAVAMLESGDVERIILSRPAVEAGERLGFLPGELKEKMDPYMRPLYDALRDTMYSDKVMKKLASEEIEIAPLAFMRGRTLNNAFVILDEAQNATSVQMLMFLTRLGENSRMVVTGDPSQTDLPGGMESGLQEATETLKKIDNTGFITLTGKDVVRSKLVTDIIAAYETRK